MLIHFILVINTFEPAFTLRVNWTNGTSAELGNVLPPSHLKDPPEQIELTRIDSSTSMSDAPLNNTVIILTDPDALSRNKPVWSEMCHWIKYAHAKRSKTKSKDVMSYYPPGPPPKTGAHRYVMLALAPGNGTSKKLHLTQPSDRKHWGYSGERIGVRRWAKDNGLEVIGGSSKSLPSSAICPVELTLCPSRQFLLCSERRAVTSLGTFTRPFCARMRSGILLHQKVCPRTKHGLPH